MTNQQTAPYGTIKPKVSESITIFDEILYTEEDYTDGIVSEDIQDLTDNLVELIERIAGNGLTSSTRLLFVGVLATQEGKEFRAFGWKYSEFVTLQLTGKALRVSIEDNGTIEFSYRHECGTDYYALYIVDSGEPIATNDEIAVLTSGNVAVQADRLLLHLYGVEFNR